MSIDHSNLEFSPAARERLEWLRTRYPKEHQRALVLPILSMAQREFGWISPEVVHFVAAQIPVPPMWVEEVATFYTMYNKEPIGRWHLQVCHNISCSLMGAEIVLEHLQDKLGIKKGETTEDGEFTLMGAECLGSCGTAPMMQVNDHYYENLSLQDVDELLETLRGTADAEPAVADLPMGPGSGPSRSLPRDGRRLEAGRGVRVPHFGHARVTQEVADRPKEVAGSVDGPDYEPRDMAR
ncbi:MAG: NAD(P)H-dependent oxidoreductase subunit E [Myxococcota bacterium]|nr:NAD(P)H-dependent oxidoreductase subunit E [Myxococcota bacterium]